jgi:hypothetical protein
MPAATITTRIGRISSMRSSRRQIPAMPTSGKCRLAWP